MSEVITLTDDRLKIKISFVKNFAGNIAEVKVDLPDTCDLFAISGLLHSIANQLTAPKQ